MNMVLRQENQKQHHPDKDEDYSDEEDRTADDAIDKVGLGFEPEEILGAGEINGKLVFRIQVKNSDEWKIVKAKKANVACPGLVMEFYEKHLILDDEPFIP